MRAADIIVPSDPSSAAFAIVAALITPGSDIILSGIGMNPLRNGLITTLIEMGGDITKSNHRTEGGEAVADLRVKYSHLHGITVPSERAASMIDEYPICQWQLPVLTAQQKCSALDELRVKEPTELKLWQMG